MISNLRSSPYEYGIHIKVCSNLISLQHRIQFRLLGRKITHLDNSGQELRCVLAASQQVVNQLAQTIRSLRTDLCPQEVGSGAFIILIHSSLTRFGYQ
jgi:hypothetical protein